MYGVANRLVSLAVMGALFVLAVQLLRKRSASNANWIARGLVLTGLLGVILVYVPAAWPPRGFGEVVGLSEAAVMVADMTVNLWIASAIMLLGAATHLVWSRLNRGRQR